MFLFLVYIITYYKTFIMCLFNPSSPFKLWQNTNGYEFQTGGGGGGGGGLSYQKKGPVGLLHLVEEIKNS